MPATESYPRRQFLIALVVLAVSACASATPGAKPHDMSSAEHDRRGREEELVAQQHAGQYDPNAVYEQAACPVATKQAQACWTSVRNPTAEHLRLAEEHRRRAAEHRAASAVLRAAEERACIGISPDDRDISPFEHFEDIVSVEPLQVRTTMKEPLYRNAGAIVTFLAVPGMTPEWLQRLIDCHLARNAALGHVVLEMPDCPLVLRGVSAHAGATENGFEVAISSEDADTAKQIQARAQRLQRAAGPR